MSAVYTELLQLNSYSEDLLGEGFPTHTHHVVYLWVYSLHARVVITFSDQCNYALFLRGARVLGMLLPNVNI
jgi:hypothetical protein